MSATALPLGLTLALLGPAAPPTTPDAGTGGLLVRTVAFERAGLGPEALARHRHSTLGVPFHVRRDRVLVTLAARVELRASALLEAGFSAVEVRFGDEVAAVIEPALGGPDLLEITTKLDAQRAALSNVLTFALRPAGDCVKTVPPGTWRFLERGALELGERPLPVAPLLSLLPLPFFDPDAEADETVTFVFLRAPTPAMLRAAGLVASALGRRQGPSSHVLFDVHVGALPETTAVLVGTAEELRPVLPDRSYEAPTVELLEHPRAPGTERRLLVVGAQDGAGLDAAATSLAAHDVLPERPRLVASPRDPLPRARRPNDAPRWVRAGAPVRLDALDGGDALVHDGTGPRTLSVTFRGPPDLFAWPDDEVTLELAWSQRRAAGTRAPLITVELDGHFVAKLPEAPASGARAEAELRIPQALLRGRNVLGFHVEPPDGARCTKGPREDVETVIAGSSTLRFDEAPRAHPLPDLAAFVHDGYPFTRLADLAETAIVLAERPSPTQLAWVLSFFAHAAHVTGTPGTRAVITTPRELLASPGLGARELLFVGSLGEVADLAQWTGGLPVDPSTSPPTVPALHGGPLAALLEPDRVLAERIHASALLAAARAPTVLVGFESPLTAGKSAVALVGPPGGDAPQLAALGAPMEGRVARADVLLVADGRHTAFALGDDYLPTSAETGVVVRARWWLSNHWIVLVPMFALGALLASASVVRVLTRRAAQRVSPTEVAT